jgi:hypothetical protein
MAIKSRARNIIHSESLGVCALCLTHVGADGEIAHIVAEQIDGPRGDHPMPLERRNDPENLVYLCVACHRQKIDKYPEKYPVELLLKVKVRMKEVQTKFHQGQVNYYSLLFHGTSVGQVTSILSNICRGIQLHLSDTDENILSLFEANLQTVVVPASCYSDIECIKECLNLIFDTFDKEGEEFKFSPYDSTIRVMFYKEGDPSTFHRREEFWGLYYRIDGECINACHSIQNLYRSQFAK